MSSSNNQKEDEWINFKDKLAKLKDGVDPRYLLEALGFSGFTRDTAKELRSPCLIHGGDNTTAFRSNRDTNTWVCFTNKCHETYGNDLVALVQGVLKVDFMSAVNYLKELCGEADGENITEFKRKKEKESFINRYKTSKIGSNIVTESQLEQFKFFRSDFFLNQGFTIDVLDYFEIAGGYKDKFGVKRDIIPIRDVKGSLVAYSLRDVSSDDPELKYILTDGFDKNSVLYNLNNIEVSKPIIVVEGFKSVWRLKQYGIDNVVAVIGSEVTLGQQHLLYGYGQAGVVILFDNDNAGVVGCTNAYNSLNGKIAVTPIIITEVDDRGRGLDPADLSKKTIYRYLGRYV